MPNGKHKKIFGVKKGAIRSLGKKLNKSGKIIDVGGKHLMLAGEVSGDPRLIAVGTGANVLGTGLKATGRVLKKAKKKTNKKK